MTTTFEQLIQAALQSQFDALHAHLNEIQELLDGGGVPTPDPGPAPGLEIFDPKVQPYPAKLAGQRIGFIHVFDEIALQYRHKDNTMQPYTNPAWGNNKESQRIIVKPVRAAIAVYAFGDKYGHGNPTNLKPRPFAFDGENAGYLVMIEQTPLDGKDLMKLALPLLYVPLSHVDYAWMVPNETAPA